jgi:hypothetical protein
VTDSARHPPRRAQSAEIRESRAEPDRPFMTDPSSVTGGRTDVMNL